jgi:hypothetical protein
LVPKAVSILLIEASTCQGMPYSVPQALVDRQQEGRDLEGIDDEVGHPDRCRAEGRDRRRRVGARGGAAVAELRATVGALLLWLVARGRPRCADAAVRRRRGAESLVPLDATPIGGFGCVEVAAGLDLGTGLRLSRVRCVGSGRRRGFRLLLFVGGRFAIGIVEVGEAVAVVVGLIATGGCGGGGKRGCGRDAVGGLAVVEIRGLLGARHADAKRGDDREAGQSDGQCELLSHAMAPLPLRARVVLPVSTLSPSMKQDHATGSHGGAQRVAVPPNMPLINGRPMLVAPQHFSRSGCAR